MAIVRKRHPVRHNKPETTQDTAQVDAQTSDQVDDVSAPDVPDTPRRGRPKGKPSAHDGDIPVDSITAIAVPKGFQANTDSAVIVQALLHGGADRNDINLLAKGVIAQGNGLETRSGKPKYVPSMVSSILSRMLETGNYEIESHWKLVPKSVPTKKARTVRKRG